MTIQYTLNKIITVTSDTFATVDNLASHIVTSSQGIAGSASEATITAGATLDETKYTLDADTELVDCTQPDDADNKPIILSIKTVGAVDITQVNTVKNNVSVTIEFGGIVFDAKVDVKLNPVAKNAAEPNTMDKAKSTFVISKVTIDPNTVKFNGEKFFTANSDKDIDFEEDTKPKEMTLAQLKTLFVNNKIQVSTRVDVANNKIFSVLTIQEKTNMNNNNTNAGTNQDPKKDDDKKDDKTTWKDISIVATSIASIIGVLLLAKMSFSPSNSEYPDNIKFDDYKDDSDSIRI